VAQATASGTGGGVYCWFGFGGEYGDGGWK
jgi:hypothetical protein